MVEYWAGLREIAENLELPETYRTRGYAYGRQMIEAYSPHNSYPRLADRRIEDLRYRLMENLPAFADAAVPLHLPLPYVTDEWGGELSLDEAHRRAQRFLELKPVIWWNLDSQTPTGLADVKQHAGRILEGYIRQYGYNPRENREDMLTVLDAAMQGLGDPPDLEQFGSLLAMHLSFHRVTLMPSEPRDEELPDRNEAPAHIANLTVKELRGLRDMPLSYLQTLAEEPFRMGNHDMFVTWSEPDEEGGRSGTTDRYALYDRLNEAYPALTYLDRLERAYGLDFGKLADAYESVQRHASALYHTLDVVERYGEDGREMLEENLRGMQDALFNLADLCEDMLAKPVPYGDGGDVIADFARLMERDVRRLAAWATAREPRDASSPADFPYDPLEPDYQMARMNAMWNGIRWDMRRVAAEALYELRESDDERGPWLVSGGVVIPLTRAMDYPGLRFETPGTFTAAVNGLADALRGGPLPLAEIVRILSDRADLHERDNAKGHRDLLYRQVMDHLMLPGVAIAAMDQMDQPVIGSDNRVEWRGPSEELREDLRRALPKKRMWQLDYEHLKEGEQPNHVYLAHEMRGVDMEVLNRFIGDSSYEGIVTYQLRQDLRRLQDGEAVGPQAGFREAELALNFIETVIPGPNTYADLKRVRDDLKRLNDRFFQQEPARSIIAFG